MAKHEEFLKQVKERAEKATAEWARHPMVNEETTLREVVPFMLKTINSAIPAVNDVPKLLAIIEKLREQRDRLAPSDDVTIILDKELDEIVGLE